MTPPNPRRLTPDELYTLYFNCPGGSELERALSFGNAIVSHYVEPPTRERILLADLPIPQLTYGALRRAGYTYLDELATLNYRQLLLIRGIGELGAQVIQSQLQRLNLR